MAQITHLMQAKAAFDAADLDMVEWQYHSGVVVEHHLAGAARRMSKVLEEAEKRCIRVVLEEEETPAMVMIQESPSIEDWLTSVKDVAAHIRAAARERILQDDTKHGERVPRDDTKRGIGKLTAWMKLPCLAPRTTTTTTEAETLAAIGGKLEALMAEYEELGYTNTGLPLATCTELPSCGGHQSSIVTGVPLGRERDDDKQRIIGIITQQAAESREIETDQPVILPIFGPAGVGKTTLVKSIFYDPELFQDYAKAWVDTPEGMDLKKIYTSIIPSQALQGPESLPLRNDDYSIAAMKNQLSNLFRSGNKKLLLVLDDLWHRETRTRDLPAGMDNLKSWLCGIGRNLVVIVTTPSKSVASYISSTVIKPYELHPLSHDTCWEIIKRTSGSEARKDQEAEAAERIGREIASKCCGLPLVAKALGRTLRSMDNPQDWSALVGDSQGIWNIGRGGGYSGDPLQLTLRLHSLAALSHLKQANHLPLEGWLYFAICAFSFSKGRSISRYELKWQWRALHLSRHGASFLLSHLLLRENSTSNASAVLKCATLVSTRDDMMYDLARYALGDRLIVVDGRRSGGATAWPDVNRISNAYLAVISNWDGNKQLDLSNILPAGILALRFEDCPQIRELSDGAFPSAKLLRVLDLSGCCSVKKLPESIGKLKRLRYLNAPGIQDRVLPVWLTRLHRLRSLILRGSPLLLDLTEAFGSLTSLRHLDLSGCSGLKALPDSFGRLRLLEHLDMSGCSGLKALPNSFHEVWPLKHLDLSGCPCVEGITEALRDFPGLRYLNLSHRCGYSFVEDGFHLKDLDKLLAQLKYKERLQFLALSSCLNPLCYTSAPEKINNYVDRCIRDLVNLQLLDLSHNKFLVQLPESVGNLKELRSLDLSGCFRLDRLPESIGELKRLETLDLSGCFRLQSLPGRIGGLKRLETLDLSGCPQFGPLPESVQQKLAKLRSQGSLTNITADRQSQEQSQAMIRLGSAAVEGKI